MDTSKSNNYQEMMRRFKFRPAKNNESDYEIYYRIKSDQEAINFSGFKTAPDREKFHNVFCRIFEEENTFLYYLCDTENDNTVCATFHFKKVDPTTAEGLGYNVFPAYRGLGLGRIMMDKVNSICREMGCTRRLSLVSENNIPSIKNLEKSGAYPTGEYEMRELPAFGRKDKYLYYVTEL